jgi:hypothetical protein
MSQVLPNGRGHVNHAFGFQQHETGAEEEHLPVG